jgi:GTP cyclohydrolase II
MRAVQAETLWHVASARMPTKWGMFDAIGYERDVSNGTRRVETALAMVMGDLSEGVPLLRIHSQCFTGEILGSLRCDCHDQLEMAMQAIAEEGRGLVIYEYQEGRGIGLMSKLQACELQDVGLDSVKANHALGFKADCRDFDLPAAIVRDLDIKRVRLLSNNPRKASALIENGIEVNPTYSCCGEADAYFADAYEVVDGKVVAIITDDRDDFPLGRPHVPVGTRIEVPLNKMVDSRNDVNPSGHGVIFLVNYENEHGRAVLCFVPGLGV